MRRLSTAIGLAVVAMFLASSRAALADNKRSCLSSYVEVQRARNASRLLDARDAAIACSRQTCPERLQTDCLTWLREVEATIPTVVVSVVGPDGAARLDALVSIDGKDVPVDGRAVSLDPGRHAVRATLTGADPLEQSLVVMQGKRDQPVQITFPALDHAPSPPAAPAAPARPPPVVTRPTPPLVFAFGALAVVGIGTWAVVGGTTLWGPAGLRTLHACTPHCSQARADAIATKLDIAGVAAGVGLIGLGLATYFYLTRPTRTIMADLPIVVAPSPTGAVAGYTRSF